MVVAAGQILRASDINAITESAWTSYGTAGTILSAVTTAPVLGSSTWAAAYLATTDLVTVRFNLTVVTGGAWSAGSGAWLLLMPFPISSGSQSASVGSAFMDDFGTAARTGSVVAASSNYVSVYRDSVSAAIGSGGPGSAWASNDKLLVSYTYEPA